MYVTKNAVSVCKSQSITIMFEVTILYICNRHETFDVVEAALAEHQIKLSQLNVLLQMGSTESIKLFLENSEALGIVSIRAVTRELMSGRLKVIEVEGFCAERMFTFAEPQGQNGGVEESFIRYACQNWR